MNDLISRQAAIDQIECLMDDKTKVHYNHGCADAIATLKNLPSEQPEQTKMINEIREWINSGNRGSADYFIVDKIEEIVNKYE